MKRVFASEGGENEAMRHFKVGVTYGKFIQVLENFPDILDGYLGIFEQVKSAAIKDATRSTSSPEGGWGWIHGDFWSGK